jgi:Na+/melibiose symporter-like transporter
MSVLDQVLANPYQVLGVLQIALLLAASALLLYPVVAYARNVAYTEGLVGVSVGFFLLTFSNVFGLLIDYDVIATGVDSSAVVRAILNLGASVTATIGIYAFARQFIDTDGDDFQTTERDRTGGFDDADD